MKISSIVAARPPESSSPSFLVLALALASVAGLAGSPRFDTILESSEIDVRNCP